MAWDGSILYFSSLIFTALAVFIVAYSIFSDEEKFLTAEKLDSGDERPIQSQTSKDFVLKYSRPFFKRYLSPIVAGSKARHKIRQKYRKALFNAGLDQELSTSDFFSFKLFLILGFPVLFFFFREMMDANWNPFYSLFFSVLGYFYPDLWLKQKIDQRKEKVLIAMPFVVDMLALCMEVGVDFPEAMSRVIEKADPSPLVGELETLLKEIRIGSSRQDALRQLAWRVDVLSVSSFCATLIAADEVSASVPKILKSLSGELRMKRSSRAEEKGAKASAKIIIPGILFILPAIVIIAGGPMILELIAGGN